MTTKLDYDSPHYVTANGVRFAVYEAGPENGPPIILCHGWPELAYSWKHIVPALAGAGYRVIAPDMKGFGRTDGPLDPAAYNMDVLTADFDALMAEMGLKDAIFLGHDWGGAFVWPMAYRYPTRVRAVASICTPHVKRAPVSPLSIFEKRTSDRHYIIQFQDPALPDKVFGGREEAFAEFIFRKPAPRAAWPKLMPQALFLPDNFARFEKTDDTKLVMPRADLKVFSDMYKKTGFQAGTNYYRAIDKNWALTEGIDLTVHQPSLMIGAELDMMLPPEQMDGMETLCPDLEKKVLKDCGHWAMWEQPTAINAILTDWLARRF
ncbi:MAG: alpha/beta hydrolase [Parvularculaceae bacterium]